MTKLGSISWDQRCLDERNDQGMSKIYAGFCRATFALT